MSWVRSVHYSPVIESYKVVLLRPPRRRPKLICIAQRSQGGESPLVVKQSQGGESPLLHKQSQGGLHQQIVGALPPVVVAVAARIKFAFGVCVAAALMAVGVRAVMVRWREKERAGSVADLVRRGQIRSDRRGIRRALKYEDPFNNPMVKVGKSKSTVEMCGKVYRLAPVTLTEEQRAIHQKRRSRAYQWKRPTVFLKEGDSIPPNVDPDTVRWIPANHPFATTATDIDEDLAHSNVRLSHGVPFRIQAEHQALHNQLRHDHKLNIDSANFETAFNSNHNPSERVEENFPDQHMGNSNPLLPERLPNSSSEEMQKP